MISNAYLDFEDEFRGSRAQIVESLKKYDWFLDWIKNNYREANILDIGCGRGEWLEKCKDMGFQCIGFELNEDMVTLCKGLNLQAIKGNAIDLIKDISSESLNIVSIFHLIEHLNEEYILSLMKECRRVLKPEGFLLLETPSIDNILVSGKLFYLDPTHINHINPDYLKFTLHNLGFKNANYYFINPGPLNNSNSLNLTRVLNGVAQDISVIATSNNRFINAFAEDDSAIEHNLNVGLSTLEAATEFDSSLRGIEYRLKQQEEGLLKVRQENIILQKKLDNILSRKPFHWKKLGTISSLFKKILKKIPRLFIKIASLIVSLFKKFNLRRLLDDIIYNKYIFRIIIFVMSKLGIKLLINKLVIKQRKSVKLKELSLKVNRKLYNNYLLSHRSKRIFDEINSLNEIN
tara:strand:- start:4716 stop:5930 length:1215 start_codon:yes stop_codon:yes gene_type:complete